MTSGILAHEVELTGLIVSGTGADRTSLVVLRDSGSKLTSAWLGVGRNWQGYRVTAIDREKETVTLAKDSETFVLHLVDEARIGQAEAPVPPKNGGFVLLAGSMEVVDGKTIYSPGTVLQFGNITIRTRNASVESDGTKLFGHPLLVEIGNEDGKTMFVNASQIKFSGEGRLTMEVSGGSVTMSATKAPDAEKK